MIRNPLRIATTRQLERAVREAGFETILLPEPSPLDIHGSIEKRASDGIVHHAFLEKNPVDLIVDFNTTALTLIATPPAVNQYAITSAALGIPYVSCYLDPVTSTMQQVPWESHWHILEQNSWIKWMYDDATAGELIQQGIPNVLMLPMGANNDDFDTTPAVTDDTPVVSFIGHPASTWFSGNQTIQASQLFAGVTGAAVHADMPDLPFHKIYYDLYEFAEPPKPEDEPRVRAGKAQQYHNEKFFYCAFLAVKRRERWVHFLQKKLGDAFELIGDHWGDTYGLRHQPRIWDRQEYYQRLRRVPICLNLLKACPESGMNLRHFEVTAAGGFLLTYHTAELARCFDIGKECEVFHDEQELLEKIGYYASHPKERAEIAQAGQRRTLSEHLYSHRITSLVEMLRQHGVLPKPPGAGDRPTEIKSAPAATVTPRRTPPDLGNDPKRETTEPTRDRGATR